MAAFPECLPKQKVRMRKSDRRVPNRQRDNQSTVTKDHVEAVNDETGERFIVRGEDVCGLADQLAGMVGASLE